MAVVFMRPLVLSSAQDLGLCTGQQGFARKAATRDQGANVRERQEATSVSTLNDEHPLNVLVGIRLNKYVPIPSGYLFDCKGQTPNVFELPVDTDADVGILRRNKCVALYPR